MKDGKLIISQGRKRLGFAQAAALRKKGNTRLKITGIALRSSQAGAQRTRPAATRAQSTRGPRYCPWGAGVGDISAIENCDASSAVAIKRMSDERGPPNSLRQLQMGAATTKIAGEIILQLFEHNFLVELDNALFPIDCRRLPC